jgi:hypothetical protein
VAFLDEFLDGAADSAVRRFPAVVKVEIGLILRLLGMKRQGGQRDFKIGMQDQLVDVIIVASDLARLLPRGLGNLRQRPNAGNSADRLPRILRARVGPKIASHLRQPLLLLSIEIKDRLLARQ